MNIRDIEYIAAVAELSSFSAAALRCHVSQPSLSSQIKKVEDELGVKLFERTKRSVRLTAFGHAFLVRARDILVQVERIKSEARQQIDPFQAALSIGAIATIAPYFFPTLVQELSKAAPLLRLTFKEGVSASLLKDLLAGDVDMAVMSLPTDPYVFEEEALFQDPFLLAVPVGHPLASASVVSQSSLQDLRPILLEEEHCLRQQALSICQGNLMQENRMFRATSLETIRHIVAAGQGVTLMPALARRENDGLLYIPIEEKVSRTIGVIWRQGDERGYVYRLLAEVMRGFSERIFKFSL